jgi:hypothetical protein
MNYDINVNHLFFPLERISGGELTPPEICLLYLLKE